MFPLLVLVLLGCAIASKPIYIGPLACTDPSCPTTAFGRSVNNTNFHLRDISIALAGDGFYYLTGTSTAAGDAYWTDVWPVIRMWRSKSLQPGSFIGGVVVYNLTRDCTFCAKSTAGGGCRTANSCHFCGSGSHEQNCRTADGESCGGRVWAPEYHYLPKKAKDVPGSGGHFLTFHFHCSGGGSGLLKSTTGQAFGPYADLLHGVPGGDVSLFQDPADEKVYTISSGGSIYAALLTPEMSGIVSGFTLSPECGNTDCANTAIGFEGPFMVFLNGTYFLSSSAFGNASQHGGPTSVYNSVNASSDSHYSAYMGSAKSFLGPYTDGRGQPGSWLAVDSGGHNMYFTSKDGDVYSTIWYGSDPNGDTPAAAKELVDLPSVVKCEVVDSRLIAVGSLRQEGVPHPERDQQFLV